MCVLQVLGGVTIWFGYTFIEYLVLHNQSEDVILLAVSIPIVLDIFCSAFSIVLYYASCEEERRRYQDIDEDDVINDRNIRDIENFNDDDEGEKNE